MCSIRKDEYFAILGVKDKNITLNHVSSCFTLTYVYIILTELYHFKTETDWKRLKFAKMIKGKTINWISGMMLFKANYGSMKQPNQFAIYLFVLAFCLQFCACFASYLFWKKTGKLKRKTNKAKFLNINSISKSTSSKTTKIPITTSSSDSYSSKSKLKIKKAKSAQF